MSNHPADIVAVGFQEVVPLNAGNVVMGECTVPICHNGLQLLQ